MSARHEHPSTEPRPIADELVDADPAAVARVWQRLDAASAAAPRTLSARIGGWAAVAVALALAYALTRTGPTAPAPTPQHAPLPEPSRPTTAGHGTADGLPAAYPRAADTASNTQPPAPARPRRVTPAAPAPAPPRITPSPEPLPARAAPAPPSPEAQARAVLERHGPTAAGVHALIDDAVALTDRAPQRAAALLEAGLAAGLPPIAALHVALSDAWAASGEPLRAARAARRALRAAPDGPHAARMRSRAVPTNPPR